jgi:hypothetical protein
MEMRIFSKSWFSTIVQYSIFAWTIFCIIGTWFVIIKYDILLMGLAAVLITFFFAATIWIIPITGLILLSLYLAPREESPSSVTFKELIKRGMSRSSG